MFIHQSDGERAIRRQQEKVITVFEFYKDREEHYTILKNLTSMQADLWEYDVRLTHIKLQIEWCKDMLTTLNNSLDWENHTLAMESFHEQFPNAPS